MAENLVAADPSQPQAVFIDRNLQAINDSPVTKDWEFARKVRPLESKLLATGYAVWNTS